MKNSEASIIRDNDVDYLFSNQAARLAFKELKGYDTPAAGFHGFSDASILTLARADSWMTTALEHILLEGKGGKRNNQFSDTFQKLIPIALSTIIEEVWNEINYTSPDELKARMGRSEEDEQDPYGNLIRDHTIVIESSQDNCLYLVVTSKYFKENICSWYGEVKDCFIGRCEKDTNIFTRIESTLRFDNETSLDNESDGRDSLESNAD